MSNEYIGMIFSILGMIITVVSFQVKNKKPLLLLQTIGSSLYLLSYVFNGSGIGIVLNIIYLLRNFLYMYLDGKRGKIIYISCISLFAVFITSYSIYIATAGDGLIENIWSFVPVAASLFGTIAAAQNDVNKYRMWKYGDSWCWLLFNAHVGIGAIGGVIGEVFNQISLTVAIIRFRKKSSEEIIE